MSKTARIFISTGEVSGDMQGALLVEALNRHAQARGLQLEILALGGDRMATAGATLLGHTSAIGSIGIIESLRFVLPVLKVQRQVKQYFKQYPPDMVVLIDYMGPNLAFCDYLSTHAPQVPVVYYIAPQEWVWGDDWFWGVKFFRSDLIVRATQRVLAIFPEEARYFQKKGAQVTWVGHPLIDRLQTAPDRETARAALGIPPDQIAVVLLPASRQQEIQYLLPVICQAAQALQNKLPKIHFWIPLSLEKYRPAIEQAIQTYELRATVLADSSHQPQHADPRSDASTTLRAIAAADLAITKSGTVNLEIALLNVPQVVLYKVNTLTAWILNRVLKFAVPFVSPPNLVLMRQIVPEFLQEQATAENLLQESLDLLLNPQRRQIMVENYQAMAEALGQPGACDRAAQEILDLLP
ncbi:MAG: lipid-A-disaccharide synthase [Leptolyngbya sp.]|nr:MAG: lipid-A-disaccharide synthase [Leptolyngbya sp.]